MVGLFPSTIGIALISAQIPHVPKGGSLLAAPHVELEGLSQEDDFWTPENLQFRILKSFAEMYVLGKGRGEKISFGEFCELCAFLSSLEEWDFSGHKLHGW